VELVQLAPESGFTEEGDEKLRRQVAASGALNTYRSQESSLILYIFMQEIILGFSHIYLTH